MKIYIKNYLNYLFVVITILIKKLLKIFYYFTISILSIYNYNKNILQLTEKII